MMKIDFRKTFSFVYFLISMTIAAADPYTGDKNLVPSAWVLQAIISQQEGTPAQAQIPKLPVLERLPNVGGDLMGQGAINFNPRPTLNLGNLNTPNQ